MREACEQTLAGLAGGSTEFLRFLTVDGSGADGTGAVAVDAIGRYTVPGEPVSVVSSCDLYEFDGGQVATITSYTVELDQAQAQAQAQV